jgi:hypothetical protein
MPRPGDRWIASSLALLAMTAEVSRFNCQTACGCESAFPRRDTPELCVASALKQERAQGRPGARCTRGLVCIAHRKTRTRAYRFSGNTPAFPAQWLYGLLRALPGERLFCHRRRARREPLRNLTPAPRRQDHTTSPYASCAFVFCAIRVHRIPPRVRDVRTPLVRVRRAELNH